MFTNGNIYIIHCSYITPPKNKICLCICNTTKQFFFINTQERKGLPGQLLIKQNECANVLSYDSYIDLSTLKRLPEHDLKTAQNRGKMSQAVLKKIIQCLNEGIPTLSERERILIMKNLS